MSHSKLSHILLLFHRQGPQLISPRDGETSKEGRRKRNRGQATNKHDHNDSGVAESHCVSFQ